MVYSVGVYEKKHVFKSKLNSISICSPAIPRLKIKKLSPANLLFEYLAIAKINIRIVQMYILLDLHKILN